MPRVLVDGLVFPECPRWHDDSLWFSDMHTNRVHRVGADGSPLASVTVDHPGGLGFLPDGDLLIVAMDERAVWRWDGQSPATRYCDLSALPGEFLNDMIVDSTGRAYIGSRAHAGPGQPHPHTPLLTVSPDAVPSIAADDLVGPNGMVFGTGDESQLIVAETHASRLTAFDRAPDGSLSGRRVYADLAPLAVEGRRVFPDGLAIDREGAVWVGSAVGRRYLRVLPGGELTDTFVPPDDRWGVACTLGGPDGHTLYLATSKITMAGLGVLARGDRPVDERAAYEWAREQAQGFIETVSVAVGAVAADATSAVSNE
jgi:sugar lactone lactonase YvrE